MKLVDGSATMTPKKGTVLTKADTEPITLTDVHYALTLQLHISSYENSDEHGFSVKIEKRSYPLSDRRWKHTMVGTDH